MYYKETACLYVLSLQL